MVEVAQKTFSQADIVMWLVEPTTFIGRGEQEIAKKLRQLKCPVFLIVNKTDTVKKEAVAECIKAYRQIADFNEVVAVSALRSVNTDTLLDTVFRYLPYGPMYYDEDTVTDQPMRQIAAEMIREKAHRRPDGSVMDIEASIICERESHKGIIIGKGGSMLKAIGSDARRDIEDMLEMKVNLKLFVKVRKDWRDSDLYMKNFGYHEDEK